MVTTGRRLDLSLESTKRNVLALEAVACPIFLFTGNIGHSGSRMWLVKNQWFAPYRMLYSVAGLPMHICFLDLEAQVKPLWPVFWQKG
jgi:hypothetical protein